MEREKLKEIYESIKSDNLKLFTSLMLSKSDLCISFGRFPILSLCYLFKSERILNRFEKYLAPISKFEVVPEYFEIYKTFKVRAKKSLRIFANKTRVIYPIEMLAVLDERKMLANKFKILFKNEEILNNLQKIYNLNQEIEIKATKENFESKPKKLKFGQKFIAGFMSAILCLFSILSFSAIVITKNVFGKGTADSPIYISNQSELETALKNGKLYYALDSDIVLSKEIAVDKFSGTLDGKEHTIYLKANSKTFIEELSGTLKNLNLEFAVSDMTFGENYAILTQNNTGTIENCSFYGEISGIFNSSAEDTYVSVVSIQNEGTIENSIVGINATISNQGKTNAYLSAFAGENLENGVISNVQTMSGNVESDTVDLAGIVAINYGTVTDSSNALELSQTSSKEWHPNTAGIVMVNYNTIKNCANYGKVSSASTLAVLPDSSSEMHSYAGGICCSNLGVIELSKNESQISALGDVAVSLAGGIACENQYLISECKNTGDVVSKSTNSVSAAGGILCMNLLNTYYAVVQKSFAECDIISNSETNQVYAGGVVAWNKTEVKNCAFSGTIDANTSFDSTSTINIYAGGVVGKNENLTLEKSYAKVQFVNLPEEVDGVYKFYGGVAGFIGYSKVIDVQDGKSTESLGSGFQYISNNYYIDDASIKCAAYGQIVTRTVVGTGFGANYQTTYSYGKVSPDDTYFIVCDSLEEIPEGVRIDG